ncbi:unnamed protein product, partial [Phaeothamnion confervicola]
KDTFDDLSLETKQKLLLELLVFTTVTCGYDARTRILFRRVSALLSIPWRPMVAYIESQLARVLASRFAAPGTGGTAGRPAADAHAGEGTKLRNLKIGAAMVGGGALLALTGGLATPLIIA